MSRTDKITLAIFVGAMLLIAFLASGCKSLPGNLEIDTPFFDIEYEGAKAE
jgi:starvation-inducible outer membrane lipoprotein|tara:strand:+ start:698 stop:850 length:153 start_codon:yes stop_codon:yes gene_type:complete